MATWQENIEVYTTEINVDDLSVAQFGIIIADVTNEWVEKAPIELLWKHAGEAANIPVEGLPIGNSKILKVWRDGKGCALKDFEKKYLFTDSGSLHYATKYTPVFYMDTLGLSDVSGDYAESRLYVFPVLEALEKAYLHHFTYKTTIAPTSETSLVVGLPPRMVPLIVLGVSEKILGHKLAMMVHEEEDTEMVNTIQSQIQFIKGQINEQATRLGIGAGETGGKAHMLSKGQQ